jgi:hypothetical protein
MASASSSTPGPWTWGPAAGAESGGASGRTRMGGRWRGDQEGSRTRLRSWVFLIFATDQTIPSPLFVRVGFCLAIV